MRRRCFTARAAARVRAASSWSRRRRRAQDSPVMAAMEDELARSMSELRMKDRAARPTTSSTKSTKRSRCGRRHGSARVEVNDRQPAPHAERRSPRRRLRVRQLAVRRSQGRGGVVAAGAKAARSPPLDDDYDAMRRQIWLATDAAYKRAVSMFARKKAAFQNRADDRPAARLLAGDAGHERSAPTPVPAAARQSTGRSAARDLRRC